MKIRHFKEHSNIQLKNAKLWTSEIFSDWCVQTALLMTCPKNMLPNADKPDWEIKVSEGLN